MHIRRVFIPFPARADDDRVEKQRVNQFFEELDRLLNKMQDDIPEPAIRRLAREIDLAQILTLQ